jgi:ribonuclease J
MEGAVDHIMAAIESPGDRTSEVGLLKSQIKDEVSRYLYEQTRRRPLVFPVVVEV